MTLNNDTSFAAFIAVMFHVKVSWDGTLCSVVIGNLNMKLNNEYT
jgi:hypothetical protein